MKHNKIIILGTSSVGKTSMIKHWVKGKFPERTSPTIGSAYSEVTYDFHGKQHKIQLWDTAGEENYKSMIPIYARGASAAIIVFSLDKKQSFEDVEEWMKLLDIIPNVQIWIVGNKSDIEHKEVDSAEAGAFAESHFASYCETSALTGDGLDEMFQAVIIKVLEAKELLEANKTTETTPAIKEVKELREEPSGGCC